MKIKRFESSSMSEALRMIKKEFGEEAVILSAKSVKRSAGLLSGKRSQKVVVTAAVDNPSTLAKEPSKNDNKVHPLSSGAQTINTGQASQGKLQFLRRFNPITRTGQRKLQSKFVRLESESSGETQKKERLLQQLVSQGVKDAIASDFNHKAEALINSNRQGHKELRVALSQVIQAKEIVAPARHADSNSTRIVVMVGPSGVGKTTMVAKLAATQVKQAPGSVSFLSLDDQRVAGRAELERYASILGVPLETASGPDEVADIIDKTRSFSLVVVDTPGLGGKDTSQRERLRRMIEAIPGAEIHLMLSADSQGGAMNNAISFYKPVGPHRLGFTRMDWGTQVGELINQTVDFGLPVTYLSSTADVTRGIEKATPNTLAEMLLPGKDDQVSALDHESAVDPSTQDIYYVANRNSDIFHKNSCKSVKRINNDNMVVFHDPAEAMGLNFKPCRMCCGELTISKPIQRVAYKYASSR